jgi:hypothetical protein
LQYTKEKIKKQPTQNEKQEGQITNTFNKGTIKEAHSIRLSDCATGSEQRTRQSFSSFCKICFLQKTERGKKQNVQSNDSTIKKKKIRYTET